MEDMESSRIAVTHELKGSNPFSSTILMAQTDVRQCRRQMLDMRIGV